MNQQLNDKIHAAFEPIKEAVEEKGEYAGALLGVTYGTKREDSDIWFEEAGNLCTWRAASNRNGIFPPSKHPNDPDLELFNSYRTMWIAGDILAAVLMLIPLDGSLMQDRCGNPWACYWLLVEHQMRVETVVKTTMAMTMNAIMQQQAQAALMAQQMAQGKLLQGPFGKSNGGLGRG